MTTQVTPTIDEARVEAFVHELFGTYTSGMLTYMIDLAHRTGLLETLADGAGTSERLADRAGLTERYVRECLGALACGGVVEYDAADGTYHLPPEHAMCLTGDSATNLAPAARFPTLLAKYVDGVEQAFHEGGGVPYQEFRPEFTDVMDATSRGVYGQHLVDDIVPLADGLAARLAEGIRVADLGCGTGHTTNLLARAFPASTFVGYDLAANAIDRARDEAAAWELDNVTFEVADALTLPADPPFAAVFTFDVIHDLTDPAGVLGRILDVLEPGGTFVMVDIKASSHLEDNIENPLGTFFYALSTLHCMTISLAEDGAGLGTAWGEQTARQMLDDAGFVDVEVHEVPDDPFDCVYVSHRP